MTEFTQSEIRFSQSILQKQSALRSFLAERDLQADIDPAAWFHFLNGIKGVLGNLNNDIAFVATLLIKSYLKERFSIIYFGAGNKAQGAPGIDIEAKTPDGKTIVGELKTTKPYQPGFGAAQKTSILKDMNRLASTEADFRLMFVTDLAAHQTLTTGQFKQKFQSIEIVNLIKIAN
ncbi:MAG TPA: hypothetical protein VF499_06790 [Afipia sp.]